jgi:hypothetical protein
MSGIYGQYSDIINMLGIKGLKYPTIIIDLLKKLRAITMNVPQRKGYHDASGGTYPSADPEDGDYWVINVVGNIGGVDYYLDDWIVWTGAAWERGNNQGGEGAQDLEDIAYDATTWNGNLKGATKNTIRDEFERHYAAANEHHTCETVSDEAYNPFTWGANMNAATKNAIYDLFEVLVGLINTSIAAAGAAAGACGTPIGSIRMWGSSTPPTNWLLCDGSAISQTTYADLFALIGDNYGETETHFYLPDHRGMFLRGRDDGAGIDPDVDERINLLGLDTAITGDVHIGESYIDDVSAADLAKLRVGDMVWDSVTHFPANPRITSFIANGFNVDQTATSSANDKVYNVTPIFRGTLVNGSASIINISAGDISRLKVGMNISDATIPKQIADSIVLSIGSTFIVVSNSATANGARVFHRSGGLGGDNVGSTQSHALNTHTHQDSSGYSIYLAWNSTIYCFTSNSWTPSGAVEGAAGFTSSNESRPVNININYIIKYQE